MKHRAKDDSNRDHRKSRVYRLVLLIMAASAIVATATGSAGAQEQSEAEVYSSWHAEQIAELDALFASVTCPVFAGHTTDPPVTQTTRTVQGFLSDSESIELLVVADQPSLRCNFTADTSNQQSWFEVTFTRDGESANSMCTTEPAEGSTIQLGNLDPKRAVAGQYQAASGFANPALLDDAIRQISKTLAPAARGCPAEPVAVTCPTIVDYETPEARIETYAGAADTYKASCFYSPLDDTTTERINYDIQVSWVPPLATSTARLESLCATETTFDRGWGTISGEGLAIRAVYGIASINPIDTGPVEAATRAIIGQVAVQSQSCEGVEFVPRSKQFTPIPGPYASAFTADLVGGPQPPFEDSETPTATSQEAGGTPPTAADGPPAAEEVPESTPTTEPLATAASQSDSSLDSWLAFALRIGTIALLVVSLLGLLVAFLLIRRETRVRPVLDVVRLGITLTTTVAMIFIFSRGAPIWAVAVALVVGLSLGFLQGKNLAVRVTDDGVMAKRSAWAIAAFAAGLMFSQIAGLLNRTGAIAVGIAMSFLSAALIAGLIAGRQPRLAEARRVAAGVAVIILVGLPTIPLLLQSSGADAQEDDPQVDQAGLEFGAVRPEERTAETDALIDFVPWEAVEITGGLWWDKGKPWTLAPVPRALDAAPETVTRTVEWNAFARSGVDTPDSFSVTETFEFSLRADGQCCSITYTGEGTRIPANGDPEVVKTTGRLDDIHSVTVEGSGPIKPSSYGGQPFTEVNEWNTDADGY